MVPKKLPGNASGSQSTDLYIAAILNQASGSKASHIAHSQDSKNKLVSLSNLQMHEN